MAESLLVDSPNDHETMLGIDVKAVRTSADRRRFLQFPWKHYRNDPNWIPPLRGNQKQLVGYKRHPFYLTAEVQTFLAWRESEVCGRIAAIVNHAHNKAYRDQTGFIGFFESEDDPSVATALFEAAAHWLSSRGMTTMRGPVNPSLNYECGLLVEGMDSPPTFMMTYNPAYYGRLWEGFGFEKSQDLYAYWGHIEMLGTLDEKLAFIAHESKQRLNIRLRQLDKSKFLADVRTFLDIYNRSLVGTWGFVALSTPELEEIAKSLKYLIVPEMTCIAEVNGKPIGAVFGLLDYNPRIKEIDGRLFPVGFIQLIRNRNQLERVRMISTNVLPEYHRWGVGLVLLNGLLPSVLGSGVKEAEFSWVLESNHLSRASLERGGAIRTKTYRIYDRSLKST